MYKKVFSILCLFIFTLSCFAESNAIPYTLEDRDRMIRLEEKFDSFQKQMDNRFAAVDAKFEAMQKQIDVRFDAMQNQINFTNGLIMTLIASLIGSVVYMWWDRRSANAPIKESLEIEKNKSNELLKALKEYSNSHPDLKVILDRAAFL